MTSLEKKKQFGIADVKTSGQSSGGFCLVTTKCLKSAALKDFLETQIEIRVENDFSNSTERHKKVYSFLGTRMIN